MRKIISVFVLVALLVSCSTSNHVVNDGFFQKRKHTSGWFIKKNKRVQKKSVNEENLALQEQDRSSLEEKVTPQKSRLNENTKGILEKPIELERSKENTFEKIEKETKKTNKHEQLLAKEKPKTPSKSKSISVEQFTHEQDATSQLSKKEDSSNSSSEVELILLVLLCFLLPPLAVWFASGDETQLIISIILTLLFWVPGIIHALLIVFGVI